MHVTDVLKHLDYLAVLIAAASHFIIGALWYSPMVFGKVWMKELGITPDPAKRGSLPLMLVKAFIFAFIISTSLAMIIGPGVGCQQGMKWGAAMSFLLGGFAVVESQLFEMKSTTLMAINVAHQTFCGAVGGAIIGAMQ